MFSLKKITSLLALGVTFFFGSLSYGQIVGGNAYLMGDLVNVAVDGAKGKEGTATGAGFHFRGGAAGTPCGFVADPGDTGWDPSEFDGDFFTPGSPENGYGIEIDGTNYNNNAGVSDSDIIADTGYPTHTVEGDCITVEWQGSVAGVTVNIKYHLVETDLFYTTEVTLINNSGSDLTDVYYYRNVDPDNNQSIGGTFTTTNTIVSQPTGSCQKSLVSAEQSVPHPSYLGFGALGPNFRVSHGGFSNRSGSDIWNGTGGLTGTVGAVATADAAISLAYKTDIDDTDTVNFTFAIVLSEAAVEGAFSSLYYIDYSSVGSSGGGIISQCNPIIDTAQSCAGNPVLLTVDGPNADDYDWTWTSDPFDPDAPTTGPTIEVSPDETTEYTVVGDPISECLTSSISKTIIVEFSEGPEIEITDPGPQCDEFDITTLEFEDLNGTEDPNIIFLTEYPDSAGQVSPEFVGPLMGPTDEVWLLIGDTANGCYDAQQIIIEFGGLGAAGDDSTVSLCGTEGTLVDLHDLISDGASLGGSFDEVTASGQFNPATGVLDVSGLSGTYEFTYTVEGLDPCPDDEASFFVVVFPQPVADFEYEVGEFSSATGLSATCIENTIDFVDVSTIPAPGTITGWSWDFGDGTTSTDEAPSHDYAAAGVGTYTITLTVTTDDGCTDTYTKDIIIYDEPIVDVIFNEPTCNGLPDASVTVFVAGGSGAFDIEITDSEGEVLNVEGSNTANTLTAGTYTVNVSDASGCSVTTTVTILDPPPLEAFYRVVPPLCFGDSGYIVIDTVIGEAINNQMAYFWAPETDVSNGPDADSVNVPAGDYVLLINDSRGCAIDTLITMTQPDSLYFNSDTGFDPAYCRLYDYQNGNGQVYASASGGTPDYDYVWTDLQTGATTTNTTWGGRNPGDYQIVATDDNGCTITQIITVDSLNPIADFEVNSDGQLNTDLQGTAPVMDVSFTNTSLYFANPNNPPSEADSLFWWNLDTTYASDIFTYDYTLEPDTSYLPKGQTYYVTVCLEVQNKNGCTDEHCKVLTIYEPITFVNVNVFSPNGDGENDVFTFNKYAASISTFKCTIVNRWGDTVGIIDDITGGWDGTNMSGNKCPDGVYFYTYEAVTDNSTKLAGQGTVTIVGSK